MLSAGAPHVEPDRRIEREDLMQQHRSQFVLEDLGILLGGKVAVLLPRRAVLPHHPIDQGLEAGLALWGAESSPEILGGHDRRGVDAPGTRELDSSLFEDHLTGFPVLLDDITTFPGHLLVRVDPLGGEDAGNRESTGMVVAGPRRGSGLSHGMPLCARWWVRNGEE